MITAQEISKIVETNIPSGAFKSNIFQKEDLISDIYLYLVEQNKELNEQEIRQFLKKKYSSYFTIYDIKDGKSYDKYEPNKTGVQEKETIQINGSQEVFIYEFFEKIRWETGIKCPKCQSKEVFPSQDNIRYIECRNCGDKFSFSQNTNLHGLSKSTIKSLFVVYNMLISGIISLRTIQKRTKLSKGIIYRSYLRSIPNIINGDSIISSTTAVTNTSVCSTKLTEYPHQTESIQAAIEHFKIQNRGKIIHPCGSGKTHTVIQIAKRINANNIIVVVPARALLLQHIYSFREEFKSKTFYAFGSLNDWNKQLRKLRVTIFDPSVKNQIKKINTIDKDVIIFTTLDSFTEISDYFKEGFFDLAIFDEAHRIAGGKNKESINALHCKSYKKALFVTATEKTYIGDSIGTDNEKFGDIIHKISMKDCIERNVILDYKIINIYFRDENIRALLSDNKEFFVESKVKINVKSRILISAISLIKAIEDYPIKKIITYHATIEEAVLFISIFKKFKAKHGIEIDCYNVHSQMSGSLFEYNISGFTNAKTAVISSVNCFQEGINISDVDAILYGYPKESEIDIVQSIGRCIRKSTNKENGYIIVPDSNNFKTLSTVLDSLESGDDRITKFKERYYRNPYTQNIEFIDYKSLAKIEFDSCLFYNNIRTTIGRKISATYEECKDFAIDAKIKTATEYKKYLNIPLNMPINPHRYYKEWCGWRNFLDTKNKSTKNIAIKEILPYEQAKEYIKTTGLLLNKQTYLLWTKEVNFPTFLYKDPASCYKDSWNNWTDYLSNTTRRSRTKSMLSYNEFKSWALNNNITSSKQYRKTTKPLNLPSNPDSYYKEWVSWGSFLNKRERKMFVSYQDAKKMVKPLNIKTVRQWQEYVKHNAIENNLPKWPREVYRESWVGWSDFLGT